MTFKRLIPVLLLKDGLLVRSQNFRIHQSISEPIPTIKRLSDWNPDEIILLNIGQQTELDSRRTDKFHSLGRTSFYELVSAVSKFCFSPLSVGGGIQSLDDFHRLFQSGADKCVVNTLLYQNPTIIHEAVACYGSQAVVASLDVKLDHRGNLFTYSNNGNSATKLTLDEAINYVIACGCGEILISSIDNDGLATGYDQAVVQYLNTYKFNVPVILNSGARTPTHFLQALEHPNVNAAAASNVFYFTELSYPNLKRNLSSSLECIRPVTLASRLNPREPSYSELDKQHLLSKASEGHFVDKQAYTTSKFKDVTFCNSCVYPSLSATPLDYDNNGTCMGCIVSKSKFVHEKNFQSERKQLLLDIISKQQHYNKSEYDCIVPVSGGKDSYYQAHYVIKELGLKPLLVTYNGNNYSEVGLRNLHNMRRAFDCDHIIFSPSEYVLKRLNRAAFIVMGDMNWHNHVGISTIPAKVAELYQIPLIFWGEHGYTDLCGQFMIDDYPEMNYRERLEQDARGFEWNFFVGIFNLNERDMSPWKYPSDQSIYELHLRQPYLGNYIPWESNTHLQLMIDLYGFEVSSEPFERTYRTGSNLDDIHENGVHDYLKYIKFGYGRCTDHASKDIRAGRLTRDKAISLVNQMDPIKPKDLQRWLQYVDMSEDDFDRIADHFRDPRVWSWNESVGWYRTMLN